MSLLNAGEEGVSEGFVNTNTEVGVELEHAIQKITRILSSPLILVLEVDSLDGVERLEVADSFGVSHESHVFLGRSTQHVKNDCQLVILSHGETVGLNAGMAVRTQREARLSGEKRLSVQICCRILFHHTEQFSKDTSYRPHVNGWSVVFLEEDEFGCAVPSRDHMPRQLPLHILPQLLRLLQL